MKIIDRWLNSVTMYRLTVYYLIFLLVCAVLFGALGLVHYQALTIVINTLAAVLACYFTNLALAKLWRASTNTESSLITALIVALLVSPTSAGLSTIILVSVAAMLTKYLFTVDKAHVFNPAAAGMAVIGLLSPEHAATWWVGNVYLIIPVLLGGGLLLWKIRRANVAGWFLGAYAGLVIISLLAHGSGQFLSTLWFSATNSALLFFALVMLTEPLTLPNKRWAQNLYAVLVALLYVTPQLRLGVISLTPELALCTGNLAVYLTQPRGRFYLSLLGKRQLAQDIWLFQFSKPAGFKFQAGQYLEWTLPHPHPDDRGNRRYFTIASAPSSQTLQLLVRFNQPSSSYKQALQQLVPRGATVSVGSPLGEFTLPTRLDRKIAVIAGGVGVAPFASFAAEMLKTGTRRDVVMLYLNKTLAAISWSDLFQQVAPLGWQTHYVLTDTSTIPPNWPGQTGPLTARLIEQVFPDLPARQVYISGPQPMVKATEQLLAQLKLPHRQIKTDYFPGYAD